LDAYLCPASQERLKNPQYWGIKPQPLSEIIVMGKLRLSFDDGPKPTDALTKILTILADHSIIADFYVNGIEMDSAETKAAVRKIHDKGHKVENHAWSHKRLDTMSLEEVRQEISRNQDMIQAATGRFPTRLRPPYGAGAYPKSLDTEVVKAAQEFNLTLTLWQVDTEDWKSPISGKYDKILSDVKAKQHLELTDILMHVLNNTADGLNTLIEKLKEKGYEFG